MPQTFYIHIARVTLPFAITTNQPLKLPTMSSCGCFTSIMRLANGEGKRPDETHPSRVGEDSRLFRAKPGHGDEFATCWFKIGFGVEFKLRKCMLTLTVLCHLWPPLNWCNAVNLYK
ncbi:hypothetical protein EVAR_24478_1 [Eumeta japonica]|uniref:Uncharacterized protein n=1 Tax=Eumeta variegata TaxID=151549 RepID=A0A4C1WXA2_EUMVA|nr:hypothetical protein EVAR_24478_1 [Eumeta japonica]